MCAHGAASPRCCHGDGLANHRYEPDILTMQECDHFYDFFLPALEIFGYWGAFSPKNLSPCLRFG